MSFLKLSILFLCGFLFSFPGYSFNFWQWNFIKEKIISKNRAATEKLFQAVRSSDIEKARKALNEGAVINAQDSKGRTPLHEAVYITDFAMAEFLLDEGADPNILNRRNRSPLHWAVLKPSSNFTLLLLKNGADPNILDQTERAPLHWLAMKPTKDSLRLHLRYRTSKTPRGEYEFPLYWEKRDLVKMRLLLKYGADPNLPGFLKKTPLHLVVTYDRLEAVKLLVRGGADVNARDWGLNEAPLHLIGKQKKLQRNSLAIAQFLLENGADPNSLNFYKVSPSTYASKNGHQELFSLLDKFGGRLAPKRSCKDIFKNLDFQKLKARI